MVTRKKQEEVKEKEPEAEVKTEVPASNDGDAEKEDREIKHELPEKLKVKNRKGKMFEVSRDYYLKNIGSVEIVDE